MTAWRDTKSSGAEIQYTAPQSVRDVIASLGRTEDVRFSPGNRRLAIAAFNRSRIAVFDIDVTMSAAGKDVALTRAVVISSTHLKRPHGLDFIDDATLIVANREGDAAIFKLPPGEISGRSCELSPIQVMRVGESHFLKSPGSVSVAREDQRLKEILICNNSSNSVTRHLLDRGAGCAVTSSEVLLEKWLDVPDGVSVSRDRRWIAVSNHGTHNVLLYEDASPLSRSADPDGMLRCVHYPHGLRFSADDRHIFVADAGAPYIHLYAKDDQGWRGVRNPVASFRVMDDSVFQRGRHNPQEGGPKGLDIDGGMNVLVVTSEFQPLAFFDLPAILDGASLGPHLPGFDASAAKMRAEADPRIDPELFEASRREQQALQVRCELEILEQARQARTLAEAKAARAKARLAAMKKSAPWRMTAPLRWIYSALRRIG